LNGLEPEHSLRGIAKWAIGLLAFAIPAVASAVVTCNVTAVGPDFGIYNPLSAAPTLSNGTVTATCTLVSGGTTTVSLVSSYSIGSGTSYASRVMVSGANTLAYNLFYDAAFTQIRGNGTGGSQTGGASFTLTRASPTQSATSTIYGRIPAGQDVAPGLYADTIIVTITY
jgi:spore coat protein U-like protein